jgi:hypothetical protein
VPLRAGRCRACLIHVREHGPATALQPWVQLWFALPGAGIPRGSARWTRAGEPEAAPAVSPHPTDPAQLTLFTVRRDWRPVLGAASLPALTGTAQQLLDDFSRAQPAPGDEAAGKAARALRILAAWLGAEAPFHEADVRAMAGLRRSVQVRRVLTFLAVRDMLIPDPGRQAEPRQHAVNRLLASLPGQIGREATTWVTVVRGHGRVPHLLVSQQTAADTSPVGPTMIGAMFEPLGVRPDRLRQDRILDEARHTADPVHLVRVFGINESTAINYVHAAHPGRQSVIPR